MNVLRKSLGTFFLLATLFSCNKEESPTLKDQEENEESVEYTLSGLVQKGPFVSGSTVTAQELTNDLVPAGSTFNYETTNDFGEFEFLAELANNFVEIQTIGFYFNEVSGELVDANLTLRAIADVESSTEINVNILTTLSKDRIKNLIQDGKSFNDAKIQAETEILQAFNLNNEVEEFITMDISQAGEKNAILLAISVIVQGDRTVANFSEFLSKLNIDLGDDGQLSTDNIADIQTSAIGLSSRLLEIRGNLEERYQNLGLSNISIPDFEPFIVQISDQPLEVTTIPEDGEVQVSTDSIILKFNSPIRQTNGLPVSNSDLNSLFLLSENGNAISFQGRLNEQKNQVVIKSDSPLKSVTMYNLSLVTPIENIAGKSLAEISVTFRSGFVYDVHEVGNTFIDEAIAKKSVMHYQEATKRLLVFDFHNNQIITYNPFNNTHSSSTIPILNLPNIGAEDIAPYSNPTYFVNDRLYIRDFYFDLTESNWKDIRDPNDLSIEPWFGSIPLNEYQFISETLVYGFRKDYDEEGEGSLGFYSYDIDTKELQLLTTIGQIGTESIELYDLNQNKPIFSSESNKILFSIVGEGDTFYLELDLSDNSLSMVEKSTTFNGLTSTRYSAAFASNPANNEVIIYGGRILGPPPGYHNDIWAYRFDNKEWISYQNSSSFQLNAGRDFVYAFVPELNSMFVFGGYGPLFLDERLIQIKFR